MAGNEDDFKTELSRVVGPSLWVGTILLLMMVPEVTFLLTHAATIHKNPEVEVRCVIPQLEKNGWTFAQIKSISQPNNTISCHYYNYNFSKLNHYDYTEALHFKNTIRRYKLKSCSSVMLFSKNSDITSMYEDFNLYCQEDVKHVILIAPTFGLFIGYLTLVPLADIYGRKAVLITGLKLLTIALLMLNLTNFPEMYILARVLSGIGYALTRATTESLIIELSVATARAYRLFLLCSFSSAISFTILPFLTRYVEQWKNMQWCASIGALLFPLVEWYVPESPVWLYATQPKRKAWRILKSLRDPVEQNSVLLDFKNDKTEGYLEHLCSFDSIRHRRFWLMTLVVGIIGGLYIKNFPEIYEVIFRQTNSKIFYNIHGIMDVVCVFISYGTTVVLGRRLSLLVLNLCAALPNWFIIFDKNIFFYFALDLATSTAYYVSKLYGLENVPTTHRCTAMGVFGAVTAVITILMFMALTSIMVEAYFVIYLLMSVLAVLCCWFTYNDNPEDLYETHEIQKITNLGKY